MLAESVMIRQTDAVRFLADALRLLITASVDADHHHNADTIIFELADPHTIQADAVHVITTPVPPV